MPPKAAAKKQTPSKRKEMHTVKEEPTSGGSPATPTQVESASGQAPPIEPIAGPSHKRQRVSHSSEVREEDSEEPTAAEERKKDRVYLRTILMKMEEMSQRLSAVEAGQRYLTQVHVRGTSGEIRGTRNVVEEKLGDMQSTLDSVEEATDRMDDIHTSLGNVEEHTERIEELEETVKWNNEDMSHRLDNLDEDLKMNHEDISHQLDNLDEDLKMNHEDISHRLDNLDEDFKTSQGQMQEYLVAMAHNIIDICQSTPQLESISDRLTDMRNQIDARQGQQGVSIHVNGWDANGAGVAAPRAYIGN